MQKDLTTYTEGETVNIPIGDIAIIPSVNVRSVDAGIVAEYAEVMLAYERDKTSWRHHPRHTKGVQDEKRH